MSKKLSEREKKQRAEIRRELRAEGVLPPVKKPLNHKKFIEETRELRYTCDMYDLFPYICWGLTEMMGHGYVKPDKEAVGAAKVLRLAKARKEFEDRRREQGLPSVYQLGELYEAVKDIYNA